MKKNEKVKIVRYGKNPKELLGKEGLVVKTNADESVVINVEGVEYTYPPVKLRLVESKDPAFEEIPLTLINKNVKGKAFLCF